MVFCKKSKQINLSALQPPRSTLHHSWGAGDLHLSPHGCVKGRYRQARGRHPISPASGVHGAESRRDGPVGPELAVLLADHVEDAFPPHPKGRPTRGRTRPAYMSSSVGSGLKLNAPAAAESSCPAPSRAPLPPARDIAHRSPARASKPRTRLPTNHGVAERPRGGARGRPNQLRAFSSRPAPSPDWTNLRHLQVDFPSLCPRVFPPRRNFLKGKVPVQAGQKRLGQKA